VRGGRSKEMGWLMGLEPATTGITIAHIEKKGTAHNTME